MAPDNGALRENGALRHSEAIAQERNDPNIVVLFLLGAQMVILFLLGAAFYLSNVQAREAAEGAKKGVVCLIEQMTVHRYAEAHNAEAHNEQPPEEAEASRRRLIASCEAFMPLAVRFP